MNLKNHSPPTKRKLEQNQQTKPYKSVKPKAPVKADETIDTNIRLSKMTFWLCSTDKISYEVGASPPVKLGSTLDWAANSSNIIFFGSP